MLNLNLNSMLCNNRPPFTPPNPSEAQQWLPGAEEDKPLFSPFKYMPDKLGVESAPVVVDVAQADRAVVNLDGNDYGNLGRPALILDNIKPGISEFTLRLRGTYNSSINGYAVTLSESAAGPLQQLSVIFVTNGTIVVRVGGIGWTVSGYTLGTLYDLVISVSTTTAYIYLNGVLKDTYTIGLYTNTSNNLMFGAVGDSEENYKGQLICTTFYSGVAVDGDTSNLDIIERFNFDEGNGLVSTGINGTVVNWADGIPETLWSKGVATTKGAYGLHDLTQQVVPVAIADRAIGTFDGGVGIVISKPAKNIGLEYICVYKEDLYIPLAPDVDEVLFAYNDERFRVFISTGSGALKLRSSVIPLTVVARNIMYRKENSIEVYVKTGFVKVISNGVELEVSASVPSSLSTYSVGFEDHSGANFSGILSGHSDCDESWTYPNLTGSEGTVAVLADTNNVFDTQGIATKYNLNRHGKVTTTGFAGDEWLTTEEIDALHNDTTRFTSDSGLSVLRSLPYDDINTLDAGQIAKINRYMGR